VLFDILVQIGKLDSGDIVLMIAVCGSCNWDRMLSQSHMQAHRDFICFFFFFFSCRRQVVYSDVLLVWRKGKHLHMFLDQKIMSVKERS
jgi:hypothetical protein